MSAKALDEFGRIASYFAPLATGEEGTFNLTDDAAVIDCGPEKTVVTADMLVADVHFLANDPADLVARKALRVNLSDLAAMGAEAFAYTLCLAAPEDLPDAWVAAFAQGLKHDQDAYSITLIGGDSVSTGGGPLSVSITAFGRVPEGKALRRSGAKAGDAVYVSGTIGDGALGLKAARGQLPGINADHVAYLDSRYHLPQPRMTLGPALRDIASAAMDISDGLAQDSGHIAKLSGAGIEIDMASVPLSAAASAYLSLNEPAWEIILGGGDDYELLFTAPEDQATAVTAAAQATGVKVTRIGRVVSSETARNPVVQILHPSGGEYALRSSGYRHFLA